MNEFEDLRDDTLLGYESLLAMLGAGLGATRRRLLADSRDRLAAGRFHVVACGEFKRGKSSLLNALVERQGLFPVDPDIATCAVTRLSWGAQSSATVYFAQTDPGDPASAPPPVRIPVEQTAGYVTEKGNPGNAKNVLRIEMEMDLPQLGSGLVLVDTPGVGSVNPAHTAATRAELRFADAILFVASAAEPLGTAELGFLRHAVAHCPIVVTAITMIDKLVDAEPVVSEAAARIAQATGLDPAALVVVPVSAFRKYDALESADPELLADSGFPELEAQLWGGLAATCGAAQVEAALDAMQAALDEAAAPIDNDLAALRGDPGKVAAELREKLETFHRLKTNARSWKRDLQDDLDRAVRPVRHRLESDLDEIRDDFRVSLASPATLENPNRAIHQASDAMVVAAERADESLRHAFERVADKYAALTELAITVAGVQSGTINASVSASPPPRSRPQASAYSWFREVWMGSLAGMGAGAFVGSLIPGVGTVIGGIAGLVTGLFGGNRHHKRAAEERQRREYVIELRESVLPRLEAGRRQLLRDVTDQIGVYCRTLTHALEDELTARGDALTTSIRALEETARRDAASKVTKERDLLRRQAELAAMGDEMHALRGRARTLTRHPAGATGGAPGGTVGGTP